MPAMPVHETKASTSRWSGPANNARVRTDQPREYFARVYAWLDDDADETKKSSYRFIHHFVGSDGEPGAASVTACTNGIGVLNGARGGTVLTGSDREELYAHLAAHLTDAGVEAPVLRSLGQHEERRLAAADAEWRLSESSRGGATTRKPVLAGYAALYDVLSEPLAGGVRERIARGAFTRAIGEKQDVRALWNHNSDYVLGRTRSGTLRLSEDELGLHVEIDPPDTSYARDAIESIRRGDVDQMSFGFFVVDEEYDDGVRVIRDVDLFDVSAVAYPAYPQTVVEIRSRPPGAMAAMVDESGKENTMSEAVVTSNAPVGAQLAEEIITRGAMTEQIERMFDDYIAERERRQLALMSAPRQTASEAPDEARAVYDRYLRRGAASLTGDEVRSMTVGTGSAGGYLVPTEMHTAIAEALVAASVVRPRATVITTGTDRQLPYVSSRPVAAWTAEAALAADSAPVLGQKVLASHKLTVGTQVSEELLADSAFDVARFLASQFGAALGIAEDAAFLTGTGSGQPTGLVTGATLGVTAAAGTAITYDEVVGIMTALPAQYWPRASWIMAPATLKVLALLKDSTNRPLWLPAMSQTIPETILGRPVYLSTAMPAPAVNLKTIVFGDVSQYVIADRVGISLRRHDDIYATTGMIYFRAVKRVDGVLPLAEAAVYLKQGAV